MDGFFYEKVEDLNFVVYSALVKIMFVQVFNKFWL